MMPRREALLRAAVIVGIGFLLWALRSVIGPLLLAYLITLVLVPTFRWLAARIGRPLGAATTVILSILAPLALAAVCWFSATSLGKYFDGKRIEELGVAIDVQMQGAYDAMPEAVRTAIDERGGMDEFESDALVDGIRNRGPAVLSSLMAFFGGVFGIIATAVLIPVFVFFLLLGVPWIPRVRSELPPEWHPQFDRVVPRIQDILRLYVSSRLIVAFWKGVIGWVALLLLGFPGAFALGVFIGVFSLVPVLGPIIALLPLAAVAFIDGGHTGGHIFGLLVALSIYGLLELFEGYVLLPRIVGKKLAMSDFAVILAAMCGGALMGMFGLLIAIPALAVFHVLYDEFVRPILKTQRDADALPATAENAAGAPFDS